MGNCCSSDRKPSLLQPILPGSIVAFGAFGIYCVDLQDGSHHSVIGGAWGSIRSSVRDPDQDKLFAFGPTGIFCVEKDGSHTKYLAGQWASIDGHQERRQTACYIGDGKAIYIGQTAIYSVNLRGEPLGEGLVKEIVSGNWGMIRVAIYDDGGYIYAIGSFGVYKVNTSNGADQKISSGNWGLVDTAVLVNEESMLCFGATGIYRLNLKDGSDTTVASGAWANMHVALKDPESDAVIVFGILGIYQVNPADGTHKKLLSGTWGACHAATYDPTPGSNKLDVAMPAAIKETDKDAAPVKAAVADASSTATIDVAKPVDAGKDAVPEASSNATVDVAKPAAIKETDEDAAPDSSKASVDDANQAGLQDKSKDAAPDAVAAE
mmetsp:Transcript_25226/g.45659  ORF Transcript_25226/g.45659 Transcript_25226/m.45659 type:complete len:379 (-) Transcript_25226:52-1188(-)